MILVLGFRRITVVCYFCNVIVWINDNVDSFWCSYLAVKDAQKAANCLTRRTDRSALRAAILVLLAAGHVDSAKMYAQKYVHDCLLEFDWLAALDVVAAEPSFQVYSHVLR